MTRAYHWFQKSTWPDGPWQDEPDKIEWVDPATGYDCLIERNHYGPLCGYVAVPPQHPYHGAHYSEINVHVHGGLSYSPLGHGRELSGTAVHVDHDRDLPNSAFGLPFRERLPPGQHVWWLGFDCAHGYDVIPAWPDWQIDPAATYKTVVYVRREVTRLAKQLHEQAGSHASDGTEVAL
jgi:hypothetical protein